MTIDDETKKLLDPILNVFGGADGGLAFARLRHTYLPALIDKEHKLDTTDPWAQTVRDFSWLCEKLLEMK